MDKLKDCYICGTSLENNYEREEWCWYCIECWELSDYMDIDLDF